MDKDAQDGSIFSRGLVEGGFGEVLEGARIGRNRIKETWLGLLLQTRVTSVARG